jgi:hypothetical protein
VGYEWTQHYHDHYCYSTVPEPSNLVNQQTLLASRKSTGALPKPQLKTPTTPPIKAVEQLCNGCTTPWLAPIFDGLSGNSDRTTTTLQPSQQEVGQLGESMHWVCKAQWRGEIDIGALGVTSQGVYKHTSLYGLQNYPPTVDAAGAPIGGPPAILIKSSHNKVRPRQGLLNKLSGFPK